MPACRVPVACSSRRNFEALNVRLAATLTAVQAAAEGNLPGDLGTCGFMGETLQHGAACHNRRRLLPDHWPTPSSG
jgi:hypothetical protein